MPVLSNTVDETTWQSVNSRLQVYFRRRVGNVSDAEDLVQMTLVRAHKNLSQLKDQQAFAGWISRIAANVLTDYYRSQRQDEPYDEQLHGKYDHHGGDPDNSNEVAECLKCLSQHLSDDERLLIQEVDMQGASQQLLAQQQGVSYSALKSRVQRARGRLKNSLLACCEPEYDKAGRPVALQNESQHSCADANDSST